MNRLFALLFILILAGCSTMTYVDPYGGKFSRTRWGQEDIKGLKINKTVNGTIDVSVESALHDPTDTINALATLSNKLAEGIASGTVSAVK